jgi:competence protein ComEC
LFAELLLLVVSPLEIIAKTIAFCTTAMLRLMNNFIEHRNHLPFAVYNEIQNSFAQTILLYIFIIGICYWLYQKSKPSLFAALMSLVIFIALDALENIRLKKQAKVIVYNVPKQQGIDFIDQRKYWFVGDTALIKDGFLRNFHIQPCRTLNKVNQAEEMTTLTMTYPFIKFRQKTILLVDHNYSFKAAEKVAVDLIIISKNPRVFISHLADVFTCKQYVFDGSNSLWKINKWKKDCERLHLPHYSTADKGAFELKL